MKFADLVHVQHRPTDAVPATRTPLTGPKAVEEVRGGRNDRFVGSLFNRRRAPHTVATRRNFLKGTLTAASATAAAAVATIGPASKVVAIDGPVTVQRPNEPGYRILSKCAAAYAGHNCTPGCGSTPVCNPHCCTPDGWYRNEPDNGYILVPGICVVGTTTGDGWLWTYQVGVSAADQPCAHCGTIQFRCHDGAWENPVGSGNWITSICRYETKCNDDPVQPAPIPTFAPTPTPFVAPTPVPTPIPCTAIGTIEGVTDNSGGSVTLTGWIKGVGSGPINVEVTVDGVSTYIGPANGFRPDVQAAIIGAGAHHGFTAELVGVAPGTRNFCISSFEAQCRVEVSCLAYTIGGANPTPGPTAVPRPTAAVPTPTPSGPIPPIGVPKVSESRPVGAVEVLQADRNGSGAFASGWAGDPDTALPVQIVATVNNVDVAEVTPTLGRPDVTRAYPHLSGTTGWTINIPTPGPGSHAVCINTVDPEDGRRFLLGCRTITVGSAAAGGRVQPDAEPADEAPAPAPGREAAQRPTPASS